MNAHPNVYRRCGCTDPVTRRRSPANCPLLATDVNHGSWFFALQITDRQGRRRRLRNDRLGGIIHEYQHAA